MKVEMKLYYDYVCPFCYLAEYALEKGIQGKEVNVVPIPYELRRPPVPKVDPMHDEAKLERFRTVLSPAAEKLGVPMKLPELSPHPYTTTTFQGYYYAREHGNQEAAEQYNKQIFIAFYQEERDIGERDVIKSVLEQVGVDPSEFDAEADAGKYIDILDEEKKKALEADIRSLPTLLVGNQRLSGLFTPEELAAAIEHAEEEAAFSGMTCSIDGVCG